MSKLRDVVVVRVSERGDREDEHFHSPEVQIEAARRWARDRGERLVASPIPEIDVSGKLPLSKRSPSPAVCCFTFLLHPAPELLERHSRLRSTHASLISEILNLLAGHAPAARRGDVAPLEEALSESELRVLRYLPTNLRSPEIASELFVSLNTVRTHLRNVYAKLGVHRRADAVKRARELGLLSPSSRER